MTEIWFLFSLGATCFVVETILSGAGKAQEAKITGLVGTVAGIGVAIKVINDVVNSTMGLVYHWGVW